MNALYAIVGYFLLGLAALAVIVLVAIPWVLAGMAVIAVIQVML